MERDSLHIDKNKLICFKHGVASSIYDYDEYYIIKIFHGKWGYFQYENELESIRFLNLTNIQVPILKDCGFFQDEPYIAMEKVKGKNFLEFLINEENDDLTIYAKQFAKIQCDLHDTKIAEQMIHMKQRYYDIIKSMSIPEDIKEKIFKLIKNGDSLCHNDFHPGNLIINDSGLWLIDWANAGIFDVNIDYAKTLMSFDELNVVQEADLNLNRKKQIFINSYINCIKQEMNYNITKIDEAMELLGNIKDVCLNENKALLKIEIVERIEGQSKW